LSLFICILLAVLRTIVAQLLSEYPEQKMSLSSLSLQKLLELQTERLEVLCKFCRTVQTTRPTPEEERKLKPQFDAANAAMEEVNAEIKKRRAAMPTR